VITSFYLETHNMIRDITGYGAGKGPFLTVHDGFRGISTSNGFLPGTDRVGLDTHPYFAFDGTPNIEPIATGTGAAAGGKWPKEACSRWAESMNNSRVDMGVTVAGEWSLGFNDCGLFLRGVNTPAVYGGDCAQWQDASGWDDATKAGLTALAMAQMDTFGDYFFWTWKIGNSTNNRVESPLWSYQLGLQGGWMPADPRQAVGKCAELGVEGTPFDGTFKPWMTGGAGAGTVSDSASFPWPPATINGYQSFTASGTALPSYTATGTVVTMPPPSITASGAQSVSVGNGWFNTQDTASAPTPVSGCSYPPAWAASGLSIPATACGATGISAPTARR